MSLSLRPSEVHKLTPLLFFCKIDWTALARAQARSLGHIKTRQTGGGWFKEIFSLGVQKFFTAVQLLFMADLGKTSIRQQSLVIWIMKSSGHTLGPWFLKALHIHAMASFHWINDEFYCNFYSITKQFQVMSSILWIYERLMVYCNCKSRCKVKVNEYGSVQDDWTIGHGCNCWRAQSRQGPRFSIRMVIGIFCSDTETGAATPPDVMQKK